ncbi:MAG: SBBP repeat-containing protein, partial [Sphingomicrobium sp.]
MLGVIASLAVLGAGSAADAAQSPLYPSWKGIKQFGTAGYERGYTSALDRRGNLYVTGYTSGDLDGPGPQTNAGGYDVYVMKLNREGQVEWIRQLGSPSDDQAHYIVLDHRGHVYVTGHTDGDLDGPGPQIHSGMGDPFLVKLDEDGQVKSIRQFGTADDEFGFGLAIDVLGKLYVAGFTGGDMDGDGPGTNAGKDDLFLAKFDGVGNKRWVRQIGSPDVDVGYAVATDARGYVYVTGFSDGDLDGPGPQINAGAFDIIALKFDRYGELKWIRQFGTAGDDYGYAVAADRHRHLYISGYVSGDFDGDGPDVYAGSTDIAVLKMKKHGDLVWSRQLGVAGVDVGFDVEVDRSGAVYATGVVQGDLDGPGQQTYQGEWDVAVLKLGRDGT